MLVNMSCISHEIVHEGWLTKSPPSKRIFKARWRRRWFVLRHSGELPGQFFLHYYTDKNRRKLKGTIDLDQCEQVDAGLRFENSKQDFPHMFDVKTPKRTYYLAAESESDMNRWVDCVCQVCGLKAAHDDTSVEFTEENNDSLLSPCNAADLESPPISPGSVSAPYIPGSVSGPYIPISECISGKPLNTPRGISDFNNILSRQSLSTGTDVRLTTKEYHAHAQNKLNNVQTTICADDISKSVTLVISKNSVDRLNSLYGEKNILTNTNVLTTAPSKDDLTATKITNIESAKKMAGIRPPDLKLGVAPSEFYDSPRKIVMDGAPLPNWETFPKEDSDFSPGDIGSWSVVQRLGRLQVVDSKCPVATCSLNRRREHHSQLETCSLRRPVAPPRPPKPSHLLLSENTHHYLNLDQDLHSPDAPDTATSDEMYDIPRSHQQQTPQVLESAPPGSADPAHAVSTRHTYSNAAPAEVGNVFRYDFTDTNHVSDDHVVTSEPASPHSEVVYSNLPSPLVSGPGIPTPPAVNRELKPSRKMSDSGNSSEPSPGPFTPGLPSPGGAFYPSAGSAEPSPGSLSTNGPPSIDRTLKPKKVSSEGALKLGRPPDSSLSLRRVRAGPGPVTRQGTSGSSTLPSNHRNSRGRSELSGSEDDPRISPDNEPIYYYGSKNNRYIPVTKKMPDIQYLDLDLDSDLGNTSGGPATVTSDARTTVYKTVDFLKTEAFKRTRQEVEEERNKCTAE